MTEEQKTKPPFGVELVHVTEAAEQLIAYCARVSSPNQEKAEFDKLLGYCIRNQHWSIFEMASMCVEIRTSRAIAQQILRHRSFSFQEFSQRYAEVSDFQTYEARRQDDKNRQNSIDDLDPSAKAWFIGAQKEVWDMSNQFYKHALNLGVAKECARFLLPLNVETKLYMHGTIRSWIHYLNLRCAHGTQKEHKDIADAIKDIFSEQLPACASALGWDVPAGATVPVESVVSVTESQVSTSTAAEQLDEIEDALGIELQGLIKQSTLAISSGDRAQITEVMDKLRAFHGKVLAQTAAAKRAGDKFAEEILATMTPSTAEPVIIPTEQPLTGDK